MIVPNYYEDLHIQNKNAMPNRAYYVPCSKRFDNSAEHRELSDRFQLLNGQWKFKYYDSIHDLTELFYELGLTQEATTPSPSPASGRITVTTSISTPTSVIPSPQILPMFPTTIPAAPTSTPSSIKRTRRLLR